MGYTRHNKTKQIKVQPAQTGGAPRSKLRQSRQLNLKKSHTLTQIGNTSSHTPVSNRGCAAKYTVRAESKAKDPLPGA